VYRRYQRGGFIRHFLKDLYLLDNRPLRELEITVYAWHHGLPVPEPLGICWTRIGPFYRGAIATRYVGGVMLLDLLRDNAQTEAALLASGNAIRRMHEAGIYHADLQVRNILIENDAPILLDFDNARLLTPLGDMDRARNLLRLRRSFVKNTLPEELFQLILNGYGDLPRSFGQLDAAYRAKGRASDAMGTHKH
jgi:3-deoxy-D-manno-octulosonic acid kinase